MTYWQKLLKKNFNFMKKKLTSSRKYFHDTHLCDDFIGCLRKEISGKRFPRNVFYVVDANVDKSWGEKIRAGMFDESKKIFYHTIRANEKTKSVSTVLQIASQLISSGFSRDTVLVSIGGGITGDIAGFTASVYMRGIKWINIPTTLLAMVDASIGGKTGVNFEDYKNIIGTFKQPDSLIIDPSFLSTLPQAEFKSGFGEIIKYAFLINEEFFETVKEYYSSAKSLSDYDIAGLIEICVSFKASVVKSDEKESGIRKILNLGHTTAHAVETVTGFKITHGEAVVFGLIVMLLLSYQSGLIKATDFNRYLSLLLVYKPFSIDNIPPEDLINAMYKDKKNRNGKINFVLMSSPGTLIVDVPFDEAVIRSAVSEALRMITK